MKSPSISQAVRQLKKSDKIMAGLIKEYTVPELYSKRPLPYFHALIRAIIAQQLSVKAAQTIQNRLIAIHGGRHFKAEILQTINPKTLRECGVSAKKAQYMLNLAQAVIDGRLNFRRLAKQENHVVHHTLTEFPGIGPWSADMFLITSLRRFDIFPIGDLILKKSLHHHYQLSAKTTAIEYQTIAECWQPFRTIASLYLWQAAP